MVNDTKYEFIMRVSPIAIASFLMGIMAGEKLLSRSILEWLRKLSQTKGGTQ